MNEYQQLGLRKTTQEFRGKNPVIVQLWWIVQNSLFAWSPQFMYGWRNFLLRLFGSKIGKNVLIRPTAKFTFPWKINIGDYCRIGDDATLYSLGEITIGHHTVISQKTYLCAGGHDYEKVSFNLYAKPIVIEDQVWLAADVFVAPGVTIKQGCVVGARGTVLNDLPVGMVCYGSPAKPVKPRHIKTHQEDDWHP